MESKIGGGRTRYLIAAWSLVLLTAWIVPPTQAAWMIGGTAVKEDNWTGYPNVRIALEPDSNQVLTDKNGDFLLPWSGRAGFITFTAPDLSPDGQTWCKRIRVDAKQPIPRDSTFDLGIVQVLPKVRIQGTSSCQAPPGTMAPTVIHARGPKAGAPTTVHVFVQAGVDLSGNTVSVTPIGGDSTSAALLPAVHEWLNGIHWLVPRESICGVNEPFASIQQLPYQWQDSVWVISVVNGPGPSRRPVPHVNPTPLVKPPTR